MLTVVSGRKNALDRGQTNRINVTHGPDLDLWWHPIPCELWSCPTRVKDQDQRSVSSGDSGNKRTDRRTKASALPLMLMRSVISNPPLIDHLLWMTIFHWTDGWSLRAGFTVVIMLWCILFFLICVLWTLNSCVWIFVLPRLWRHSECRCQWWL